MKVVKDNKFQQGNGRGSKDNVKIHRKTKLCKQNANKKKSKPTKDEVSCSELCITFHLHPIICGLDNERYLGNQYLWNATTVGHYALVNNATTIFCGASHGPYCWCLS